MYFQSFLYSPNLYIYVFTAISKKSLPNPIYMKFFPMFFLLRVFIVLGIIFRSLIHVANFCIWCYIKVQLDPFACGYQVFLAQFVKRLSFSHWMVKSGNVRPLTFLQDWLFRVHWVFYMNFRMDFSIFENNLHLATLLNHLLLVTFFLGGCGSLGFSIYVGSCHLLTNGNFTFSSLIGWLYFFILPNCSG